jgi:hypothetical protein
LDVSATETRVIGRSGRSELTVEYAYVNDGKEVLEDASTTPDLSVRGDAVTLRQTASQRSAARSHGAVLRMEIQAPAGMDFQAKLGAGTLICERLGACDLALSAGTVDVSQCSGGLNIEMNSGQMAVSAIARGHAHRFSMGTGEIILAAGDLVDLVRAVVKVGSIDGVNEARVNRVSLVGCKMEPARHDPSTSIVCEVATGSVKIK